MTKSATREAADEVSAPIASPVFTGNVGVGVTPEATTASKLLQLGTTGTLSWFDQGDDELDISINSIHNSGYKYITTNEASMYTQYAGTHLFKVAPSGTAGNAISFATKVQIDTDGLKFNGDTAAANALDDYETGTFTPAGTGIDASNSVGIYTKIGNVCHTQMWILANGSTDGTITGLPFNAGTGSANYICVGTIGYISGNVTGVVGNGATSTLSMYNGNSTGSMASGNQMHLGLAYITT